MEEQKEVSCLSAIEIISAEDLAAMPLAPPLFVVEGLIPQGVNLLSGASKTGKSWLMLWLGLQVSQGLPIWDLHTHQCGVLYLSLRTHTSGCNGGSFNCRKQRRRTSISP